MSRSLDTAIVREVALAGFCHPVTVDRYLAGQPVRPSIERRIVAALVRLGLAAHIRPAAAPGGMGA